MRFFAFSGAALVASVFMSGSVAVAAFDQAVESRTENHVVIAALGWPLLATGERLGHCVQLADPDLEPPSLDDLESFPEPEGFPENDAYHRDGGRDSDAEPHAHSGVVDRLFGDLGKADTPIEARALAARIQQLMLLSGSHTVDLLMQRAGEAMRHEDYPLALDLLDAVVRLKPNYAEGWNRRATVYYLQEEFGRSISDIEQVLRLEPRHYAAMSGLAMILRRMDQNERALEVYQRVLDIYPMLDSAQEAVSEIEAELGDDEV